MHYFRIMCNPWIFAHAHALYSKTEIEGPSRNYQEVLGSFIDYLSLSNEGAFQTMLIKLPIVCVPQGQVINKIFPSINHVCIIGQTQSSIKSLFKVLNIFMICHIIFWFLYAFNKLTSYKSILYRDSAHLTLIYSAIMCILSFG